jgi:hypothetical protein
MEYISVLWSGFVRQLNYCQISILIIRDLCHCAILEVAGICHKAVVESHTYAACAFYGDFAHINIVQIADAFVQIVVFRAQFVLLFPELCVVRTFRNIAEFVK